MTRSLVRLVVGILTVAGVAGCLDATAPSAVGQIDIALTAQGASGAVYRLPPGTSLFLHSTTFSGAFPLDADAASQTIRVAPGDYSVFLIDDAGDTNPWPLTRQKLDGTTDTVSGMLRLLSDISVVENQTTGLVIAFDLPGAGPITFSQGSVAVSVEVGEGPVVDFSLAVSSLSVSSVGSSAGTPPVLLTRLPGLGDTGDGYAATLHVTGSWFVPSPNVVCAPVAATITATGNPGFVELVAEAPPSGAERLCLEQDGPQQVFLFVNLARRGAATTPLLSDLGDRQFIVSHGITAEIEAAVFDGTTLDLEVLAGSRPANINVFGNIAAQISDFLVEGWYQVNEQAEGTLSVAR